MAANRRNWREELSKESAGDVAQATARAKRTAAKELAKLTVEQILRRRDNCCSFTEDSIKLLWKAVEASLDSEKGGFDLAMVTVEEAREGQLPPCWKEIVDVLDFDTFLFMMDHSQLKYDSLAKAMMWTKYFKERICRTNGKMKDLYEDHSQDPRCMKLLELLTIQNSLLERLQVVYAGYVPKDVEEDEEDA